MPRSKKAPSTIKPEFRRVTVIIGLTTLAFVVFSLLTIQDLVNIRDINDAISNSISIVMSILGIIATWLAWRGMIRPAGITMIVGVIVGMVLIPIFTEAASLTTTASIVVVVLPAVIALEGLSTREFPVVVVVALVARAVIQLLDSFGAGATVMATNTQTALIAEVVSISLVVIFSIYVGVNLGNYPFRTKMILVLGVLTIVPLAFLTNISRQDLEDTLIGEANQSLVLSANQVSSSVDSFIQTNLDSVRTETQLPAIQDYLSQPTGSNRGQGRVWDRGGPLEKPALDTLFAILRKDPVNIISCKLIDVFGTIQLSTDASEIGLHVIQEDFFIEPHTNHLPYLSPATITPQGAVIHFSAPARSAAGDRIGVLDVVFSGKVFQQLLVRSSERLGPYVSAMLLDDQLIIQAHSTSPDLLFKIVNPVNGMQIAQLVLRSRLPDLPADQLQIQMSGLATGLENAASAPNFSGELDVREADEDETPEQAGVTSLQSVDWYLVTFVPQSILLEPVQTQTRRLVIISILISLAAIAIALGLTQILVSPILSLTQTSERIAHGDVDATADVRTKDEIGYLADGFNIMTARLRDLIAGLEQRVSERTQALERRAVQLQAAADVGSTAARLRNLDELLRQTTRLISQRFGFYHVGIFLLDERGEYAILRASNSEGGQRMLARGHKLKVGQVGIVGYVTETGQPRIASDVDEDTEYFNNPDLPLTHSEIALPLIVGRKILGALDVQSAQETAFSEEDITTIKVLADQIAIAIENARLFTESQSALDAASRAYGQLGREGWQRLLREQKTSIGFISLTEEDVLPSSGEVSPEFLQAVRLGEPSLESNGTTLHLPIKVRGQGIGAIRLNKATGSGTWSPDDISLANTLAEQLGTALESARLYNDISQRAEREFAISEIVSKIGSSIQLDTILRTTVQELGQVLGETEIILQLGASGPKGNPRE